MGTSTPDFQVFTALRLGTHDSPAKFTRKLHSHDLPRTPFRDHVVKPTIHPQCRGLAYLYDFQCIDGVREMSVK